MILKSKDGDILEELTKEKSKFVWQGRKLVSPVIMRFYRVNYNQYVRLRRLVNKLKMDAYLLPEGDLDTINLLDHPRQYKITLKGAFEALEKGGKEIGYSITFRRIKE